MAVSRSAASTRETGSARGLRGGSCPPRRSGLRGRPGGGFRRSAPARVADSGWATHRAGVRRAKRGFPIQNDATAATTPAAAVVPAAVPAVLPAAAAVANPGLGVITAAEAGAPVGP